MACSSLLTLWRLHLGTRTRTHTLCSPDRLPRLLVHEHKVSDRATPVGFLLPDSLRAVSDDARSSPGLSARRQRADHPGDFSHYRSVVAGKTPAEIKALRDMAGLRSLSVYVDVVRDCAWKRACATLVDGPELRDMERLHAHS